MTHHEAVDVLARSFTQRVPEVVRSRVSWKDL